MSPPIDNSDHRSERAKKMYQNKASERSSRISQILLADIEERRIKELQLQTFIRKLQAMNSETAMTQKRSRKDFAADLSNAVLQLLMTAKLRLQLIENQIPEKLKPGFNELQYLISHSMTQVRAIKSELSPPVLDEIGLINAPDWLKEETSII